RVARHAPYEWLMAIVPGFDGLRVPSRFAVLVFLSLAMLAGHGAARLLDQLTAKGRPEGRPLLSVVALTLLSVAILSDAWVAPVATVQVPVPTADDGAAYAWLRDRPPGGVVEFPIQRPLSHSPLVYRTREPAGYLNT